MKISYAITVCNELEEIKRLLNFLIQYKREEDEIVVLFDDSNSTKEMETLLHSYRNNKHITLHIDYFGGHFADWKNKLTSLCSKDYIFQIDADELPNEYLIKLLPEILETNSSVEAYVVPRVNTVEGLTPEHIAKWGWHVNENKWVNWPDYQWRIYKNIPNIKWKNKVHEVLDGYKTMAQLPAYEDLSLYHPKTIERQEKQNNYYNTL
jgi:hypothetical protein